MKYTTLFLLLAILAFAACNPEAPQEPTEQVEVEEELETTEETNEKSAEEDTSDNTGMLETFFTKKSTVEYQATYDLTTTTDGETLSSKTTQYVKTPEKMRFDTANEQGEFRTYFLGDVLTSCNQLSGDWNCLQIDPTSNEADDVQKKVEEDPTAYSVRKIDGRTLAGTMTECFLINVDESTVEYCFSPEGIPLYIHIVGATAGTSFESLMVASSYSASVSNSVFDLPAEPTTLPTTGGSPEDYQALIDQYT